MSAQRLLEIAQRLDELAEDGPSELVTLSEELGTLAERWPEDRGRDRTSVYVQEIEDLIDRAAQEKMYGMSRNSFEEYRRREDNRRQSDMVRALQMSYAARMRFAPAPDFTKIINSTA